jgi:hypothetical protein
MPAKDKIHDIVKNALIKAGWIITADPYKIQYEELVLFADLGAERLIAAEQKGEKIVVEIKSFMGSSFAQDFEKALGQYTLYLGFLELIAPERQLYIAISHFVYEKFFKQKAVQVIIERYQIALVIINIETEEILEWKT